MVTKDPADVPEHSDTTYPIVGGDGTIPPQTPDGDLGVANDDLRPDAKATVFDTAVNANTDILGDDLSPTVSPAIFRVSIAVDTAAVLNAQVTRSGNTVAYEFNQGNSLAAGSLFQFDHAVRDASEINYQVETGGTVLLLNVDEVQAEAP